MKTKALRIIGLYIRENWLLFYYIFSIVCFEVVYAIRTSRTISADFIFPVLFTITAGAFFYLLSRLFGKGVNIAVTLFFSVLIFITYSVYLIYYEIFKVPLSLYSITGAQDAFKFKSVIYDAILTAAVPMLLFLLPLSAGVYLCLKLGIKRADKRQMIVTILIIMVSFFVSIGAVNLTKNKHNSPYMLYYKINSPELSLGKLGLLTTIRLDLQKLIADHSKSDVVVTVQETTTVTTQTAATTSATTATSITTTTTTTGIVTETEPLPEFNVMDIDFETLTQNESNETIKDMHRYFSSLDPSRTNEYTGIFKGHNLILIVAESFYPYAVREDLTPTLYMMANEGFVFNNFYNPLFGVSTSDGEYVACAGLLPKPGVWSFYISGRNYMPFAFGNQLRALGYISKAYHNHTYTYYNRDKSHPNMGYDYKGVGNGLDIKVTWPESDLEMIEVTTDEFIGEDPFHVYYLTVSGHLQYNFGGNEISKKNRDAVEHLELSTASKAYLACNLELEYAMAELIKRLDEAGVLENTVIAISPDHYPYGLAKSSIDELVGHSVETNFELYKGIFILWRAGMEPVIVDRYCSSLDINPTLSNMFGLEYDSRLLMGNDIFSDTPPLVIFNNRSWITDKARFNSITNKVQFFDQEEYDAEYVKMIHNMVVKKFKYSTRILENNYYEKLKDFIIR